MFDALTHDEAKAAQLAAISLEKFGHKDSAVKWLQSAQVAELVKTAAEKLATFSAEENAPAFWSLLQASLRTLKQGSNGTRYSHRFRAEHGVTKSDLTPFTVLQTCFCQMDIWMEF